MPKEQKCFWKGKRISQKMYEKRLQQVEVARKIKSSNGKFESPNLKIDANTSKNSSENNATDCIDDDFVVGGRRIVHIQTLAKQLFCQCCKSILSLMDTKEEKRFGLGSILYVKCCQCKKINTVFTDKRHKGPNNKYLFDNNTKAVIGCLNNGTGNTDFNKLLAEINIPELNWHTYKTYEMEVAKKVEYVARENCMAAAIQERKLTIENAAKLKDL
ncbi:hypothetical protein PV326_009311, partial [Microctonus aethiopoides]